jgi:hypothetical protein
MHADSPAVGIGKVAMSSTAHEHSETIVEQNFGVSAVLRGTISHYDILRVVLPGSQSVSLLDNVFNIEEVLAHMQGAVGSLVTWGDRCRVGASRIHMEMHFLALAYIRRRDVKQNGCVITTVVVRTLVCVCALNCPNVFLVVDLDSELKLIAELRVDSPTAWQESTIKHSDILSHQTSHRGCDKGESTSESIRVHLIVT